jgi:hypothetical protein
MGIGVEQVEDDPWRNAIRYPDKGKIARQASGALREIGKIIVP